MTARKPAQAFQGIEYVRRYYEVPAKRGGRVVYIDGRDKAHPGTITGASGSHLRVRFDGDKFSLLFHPTDVTYLPQETR